jgi:hypothetical protein
MRVVIPGLLLGLGLVYISTNLTVGETWHRTCLECGLVRHHRVMFGSESTRDVRSMRTEWHARRMGPHPEHRWELTSRVVGLSVWQTGTGYGASPRWEPALYYSPLPRILERLERLNLDRDYHRDITHDNEEHRAAALIASHCFDPRWNDEAVREWWRKTRLYLQDPTRWVNFNLRGGTHPYDRVPQDGPPPAATPPPASRP